ncbi:MAG: sensor histidine kinase, partial [Longimicrobiales bacterium]
MIASTTPSVPSAGADARPADEILAAVVFGAQDFLNHDDWEPVLDAWLERLGRATGSHRVRVFRNLAPRETGSLRTGVIAEWQAPEVAGLPEEAFASVAYTQCGCDRWPSVLSHGDQIVGSTRDFADCEQQFLRDQGIESVAVVPVFVRGEWWGFMAFGDCAAPREWSEPVLQALSAAAGILGAALARLEMEQRIDASLAREQRTEERYRQLVEVTVEGNVMHDRSGIIDVNPSMTRLIGYTAEELVGTPAIDYIAPQFHEIVNQNVRINYQEPYEVELVHRSGRTFPVEIKGSEFIRDGRRVRVAAIRDITERKKAERTAALLIEERTARETEVRTRRQAEFLLEATQILSSSFDTSTTLRQLAHLAVRSLADFCVVTVREADATAPLVMVHADPAKQVTLEQAVEQWRAYWRDRHAFERVQATGEAFLMPTITSADLDNMARDAEHRRLLGELGTRSLMSAPITMGGELIGSIMLASSRPGRVYATEDLALAQELSRRAALAIQAARSYNHALAATRARDDLLGIVAHDLRNPLNTISMASSFALELTQDAPQHPARHQLGIIDRTVEHMNRLIQDLLDASKVQIGQLALERVPTRPDTIVREAMDMLQPLAHHAGVTLDAECAPELPHVIVDRQRMVQVLSNLVGNALKFTPEGGRIAISAAAQESGVRFTVSDTGNGIPADQIPLIFGRFYQARTDRRGLGLGLSIAKGIVEAHGGVIWVE